MFLNGNAKHLKSPQDTTDIMIILRPPRYQSPNSEWLQSDQLLGHPAVATDQAIRAGTKLVAGSPTVMHLRTETIPDVKIYSGHLQHSGYGQWLCPASKKKIHGYLETILRGVPQGRELPQFSS